MTLSNDLINNINEKYVIRIDQREIILKETKKKYEVKIRLQTKDINDIILIQNLEDLKQNNLPYTLGSFMPKDCDFILIRERKKEVFFIELKSEKQKNFKQSHSDIICQLSSGENWLRHLIFCSSRDYSKINEYKKFFVAINKGIKSRNLPELTAEIDQGIFTFWNGCSFNLSEFR